MITLFVDNITSEQIEYARKWISDLRSGKFKQARQALVNFTDEERTTKGYCCLGVGVYTCKGDDGKTWHDIEINSLGTLPEFAMKELGLSTPSGDFSTKEVKLLRELYPELAMETIDFYNLVELNDEFKLNFNQIADFVELCLNTHLNVIA